MTNETQAKPREFQVAILTPYLSEGLEQFACPIEALEHIALYNYEPDNLNGIKLIQTPENNIVKIWSPEYDAHYRDDVSDNERLKNYDLAIAGSTESGENEVRMMKGSGLVIARFSIFYEGASGYSGAMPEEAGYSLDIPKNVGTAKALLESDKVLKALVSREEAKVISAIEKLNENLRIPILITPYLAQALEARK